MCVCVSFHVRVARLGTLCPVPYRLFKRLGHDTRFRRLCSLILSLEEHRRASRCVCVHACVCLQLRRGLIGTSGTKHPICHHDVVTATGPHTRRRRDEERTYTTICRECSYIFIGHFTRHQKVTGYLVG